MHNPKIRIHFICAILLFGLAACTAPKQVDVPKVSPKPKTTSIQEFPCVEILDDQQRFDAISRKMKVIRGMSYKEPITLDVKFRLYVSKDCTVREIELHKSSGNPKVDQQLLQQIENTKFPVRNKNEDLGYINIIFKDR